jgi:hypothetical protein
MGVFALVAFTGNIDSMASVLVLFLGAMQASPLIIAY